MAETEKLASDEELILALAAGATVTEAAQRAGVGKETVYQRLKDAEFRRAVGETRFLAFDAAVGKLTGLAAKAVVTLERLLECSPAMGFPAAKAVLQLVPRLLAFTELEQRIAALEAEERKPRGDAETNGEPGEADAFDRVRRGSGPALGQLTARVGRLEAQRAERNADGRDVADPSRTPDTGTKPPSKPTKAAENVSKGEIRWR